MNETIDYRLDVAEMLNQTLRNQSILLLAMSRFVTPHCSDENSEKWYYINKYLISEYHRTREMLGEEEVGKYWRPEMGR